ncbi:MAG TPA: alanine dehydrogenase [bacterium]|nr:alanine dehydrogenase [bacterium]
MIVGVPKEIKPDEHRVALVPGGAQTLVQRGHEVLVQAGAGRDSGFPDDAYAAAGAQIVPEAAAVYERAGLILKVKEPLEGEYGLLHERHLLFTYLHLAPNPPLTQALMRCGCTAIAYETVALRDGTLPLLVPMSEVAGRMSVQVGAHALEIQKGGRGVLLAGIPGVRPGRVLILGGGVVGSHAAQMAVGLGADVVLMDIRADVMGRLDQHYRGRLKTVFSAAHAIEEEIAQADMVIGAVLVAGARAPRLVTREHLRIMQRGSVIVDVAIDQGGCCETSRPTTHHDPTYVEDGVVHYCVANIPGAVARTSTLGLTNATLPYTLKLADHGLEALRDDPALAAGLNVLGGKIRHPSVAEALGLPLAPFPD